MTILWSVLTALFILAIWAMHLLLDHIGVGFGPWRWIGFLAWLLWTFFGIAVVSTFVSERESRAARVGALILGGSSVFLAGVLALAWGLV